LVEAIGADPWLSSLFERVAVDHAGSRTNGCPALHAMPSYTKNSQHKVIDLELARRQANSELQDTQNVWFKVLGMLLQNWAVCEPSTVGWDVRFFDDGGQVFDRLNFMNKALADLALDYNEFTRVRDQPSFLHLAGLPKLPLLDSGRNSKPVYSSGEFWQAPPSNFEQGRLMVPSHHAADELPRFVAAQDPVWFTVLEELLAGKKRTHWMWFVFPQHRSLGSSGNAQHYGIASLNEAADYWGDDILRYRLRLALTLLLAIEGKSAIEVLGSLDAMKLQSCVTLFEPVAIRDPVCAAALETFFDGRRCQRTLDAVDGC
jgi:uncharacterized protein (DUF1810 family)